MVNTTEQPIVYTNATLPVIQRVEAAEANAVNGTEVSKAILNNPTYAATECTLQPIVRSVRASVSRSRYKEDNLAEWTGADVFSQNETARPATIPSIAPTVIRSRPALAGAGAPPALSGPVSSMARTLRH